MFTKKLEEIFTLEALKAGFEKIGSEGSGIDEISLIDFEERLFTNLQAIKDELLAGTYAPEPIEKIEIPKPGSSELRPIALGSVRDKVVQHALATELHAYFDPLLSENSYAYRPNRSHVKAIVKTSEILRKGYSWAIRTDIDNFFEEIDHEKMLQLLRRSIKDLKILDVCTLFLRNGLFHEKEYSSHRRGIHQGDILSPLFSNLYLDQMDKFLESRGIPFVRYADDFVLFFDERHDASQWLEELKLYLGIISLTLEESKTAIMGVEEGFTFLGAFFRGKEVTIDPTRFVKVEKKIESIALEQHTFGEFIVRLNAYVKTLRIMYGAFVTVNSEQLKRLNESLWNAVSARIYLAKSVGEITTKTAFREAVYPIAMFNPISDEERKSQIELAIVRGYERYTENKSDKLKGRTDPLYRKKVEYAEAFSRMSTLHITAPGIFLGVGKNRFVVKERGKVIQAIPKTQIERIIINAKGVSISSSVIETCSKSKIPIDFIDHSHTPYASLISHQAFLPQTAIRQYELFFRGDGLYLAKEFIEGKAKNQINYLKYLNRYHQSLDETIASMSMMLKKMKQDAQTSSEVMGFEGMISAYYWSGLQQVIEPSWGFKARITKGARDVVNSALNYAYAILYGKVQESLVKSGLSLYVSYLHVPDAGKPTLVFDMIEEFRSFVVDRTVFTMLNRNEPIRVDETGLLTPLARKRIAENVLERLGSYTTWKKESRKISNIIQHQAYLLSRHIHGEDKYTAFIGKY